jgi:hypothetical protein
MIMVDVRKGVLTPEQEDFLAQVLDDVFKFKNPLIETFDKTVFKSLIKIGDDTQLDKINVTWKVKLIPIVDAAIAKDIENVRVAVTALLNEKIDIPVLDEEQEFLLFDSLTRFIASAIDFYVNKEAKKVK